MKILTKMMNNYEHDSKLMEGLKIWKTLGKHTAASFPKDQQSLHQRSLEPRKLRCQALSSGTPKESKSIEFIRSFEY